MAVESPADIVIVGLNRLSIEAGLYARFLGYRVTLLGFDYAIKFMGRESLDQELAQCTTKLGKRALKAQGCHLDEVELIDPESLAQKYVKPLANSDLLVDCVVTGCRSVSVKIGESELPDDLDEDVEYDTSVFELTVEQEGTDSTLNFTADVLIDYRTPNEPIKMDCEFENALGSYSEMRLFPLMTKVPDFYQLTGDPMNYSYSNGVADIRTLFQILSDSSTLDLYSS